MRRFGEAHQSIECAVKHLHHSAEVALRGRVKRSRSAKARGFQKVQRLREGSAMRDFGANPRLASSRSQYSSAA